MKNLTIMTFSLQVNFEERFNHSSHSPLKHLHRLHRHKTPHWSAWVHIPAQTMALHIGITTTTGSVHPRTCQLTQGRASDGKTWAETKPEWTGLIRTSEDGRHFLRLRAIDNNNDPTPYQQSLDNLCQNGLVFLTKHISSQIDFTCRLRSPHLHIIAKLLLQKLSPS